MKKQDSKLYSMTCYKRNLFNKISLLYIKLKEACKKTLKWLLKWY